MHLQNQKLFELEYGPRLKSLELSIVPTLTMSIDQKMPIPIETL